ncbi:Hsp70 family protein [Catenuloplanes japonicus]|uniref:Hsp70 family protein n=1 Tax=Catenuloplanes japonicus TaxID=33876 RepID=UPI001E54B479|nr:Hsp70 family protein [Catenuloplanes japonicus]
MRLVGPRLGVDFGSSNTVAVLGRADGSVRPLLFDGSELLPSAVCAQPGGALLVGRDALHAAKTNPAGFEPYPKRLVDDGTVLLGEAELPVTDLFAAVLRRVADEAVRVAGDVPDAVTLTCPAAWGTRRRETLVAAAVQAGLGTPALLAEPVAAAAYFAARGDTGVPEGTPMMLYDFGAGTFDVSVVRRTPDGFEILAEDGLPDAGGLDVDAAIWALLAATYADRAPQEWARLAAPRSAEDRRAGRALWDDIRAAKELLSRSATTFVHLPLLDIDAPLGRAQFEQLARPLLERTVAATEAALRATGLQPADLAGIYLVGGSSRIPLVAGLLHRSLGVAPTVLEQPELVVALGSLSRPGKAAPAGTTPAIEAPDTAVATPAPDPPTVPAPVNVARAVSLPGVLLTVPLVVSPLLAVNHLLVGPSLLFPGIWGVLLTVLLARRLDWRPARGTGFVRRRWWLRLPGIAAALLGCAAFPGGLTLAVWVAGNNRDDLARGDLVGELWTLYFWIGVAAVVTGLAALAAAVSLLSAAAKTYPRLTVDAAGLTYQPDRHHAHRLRWTDVGGADVRPLHPGQRPFLVVRPAPGSTAAGRHPLWRPEIGGFVIDQPHRLGSEPEKLTAAIVRRG